MYPVYLKGERVTLRELALDDLDAMFEYAKDEDANRFMTWPASKVSEDSLPFLKQAIGWAVEAERTKYNFGLVVGDVLVGSCGVTLEAKGSQAEIGYCLRRDHWNQGLMTEAARLMIDFAFDELGLHRVFATHDPDNVASRRVMEKLGFKYEGRLREHLQNRQGKWRDSELRSVLVGEWKQVQ